MKFLRVLFLGVFLGVSVSQTVFADAAAFYAVLDTLNDSATVQDEAFWERLESAEQNLTGMKYVYLDYLEAREKTPSTRFSARKFVEHLQSESKADWVHYLFVHYGRASDKVKAQILDAAIDDLLEVSAKVYKDRDAFLEGTVAWRTLEDNEQAPLLLRLAIPPRHPGIDGVSKIVRAIFALGDLEHASRALFTANVVEKIFALDRKTGEDELGRALFAWGHQLQPLRTSLQRHLKYFQLARDPKGAEKLAKEVEERGISSGLERGYVFFDHSGSIKSLDSLNWQERRKLRLELEKKGVLKRGRWANFIDGCASGILDGE